MERVGGVAAVRRGSDSGSMRSRYSTTVMGQPWVAMIGRAPGSGDRTWRKWTVSPSIVVVNWGYALIRASCARQS